MLEPRYEAVEMVALFERRVASRKDALDRAWKSGNYKRVLRAEDRLDEERDCLAAWKNVLDSLD